MFKLYVDNSWTYKEIAYRAWALRFQYEEFLASFLWDQKKERNDFILECRNSVYALNLKEWQNENVWMYMNRDIGLASLIQSAEGSKKSTKKERCR